MSYQLKRKKSFPNKRLAGTYVKNYKGKIAQFKSKKEALANIKTPSTKKYYTVVFVKK